MLIKRNIGTPIKGTPAKGNFKAKKSINDRERHYKMIKRLIQKEDIATLNMLRTKQQSYQICKAKIYRHKRRNR